MQNQYHLKPKSFRIQKKVGKTDEYFDQLKLELLHRKIIYLSKFDESIKELTRNELIGNSKPLQGKLVQDKHRQQFQHRFRIQKQESSQNSNSFPYLFINQWENHLKYQNNPTTMRCKSSENFEEGFNNQKMKNALVAIKNIPKISQLHKNLMIRKFRRIIFGVIAILRYKKKLIRSYLVKMKRKSKMNPFNQLLKTDNAKNQQSKTRTANKLNSIIMINRAKSKFKGLSPETKYIIVKKKLFDDSISESKDKDEKQNQRQQSSLRKSDIYMRGSLSNENRTVTQFMAVENQNKIQDQTTKRPFNNNSKSINSLYNYNQKFLKTHQQFKEFSQQDNPKQKMKVKTANDQDKTPESSISSEGSIAPKEGVSPIKLKTEKMRRMMKLHTTVQATRLKSESTNENKQKSKSTDRLSKREINRLQVFCQFTPFLEHLRVEQDSKIVYKRCNIQNKNFYVMKQL